MARSICLDIASLSVSAATLPLEIHLSEAVIRLAPGEASAANRSQPTSMPEA
jgi:hypothetical protein